MWPGFNRNGMEKEILQKIAFFVLSSASNHLVYSVLFADRRKQQSYKCTLKKEVSSPMKRY